MRLRYAKREFCAPMTPGSAHYKRIVVKLGTSVLTGGARQLDRARMVELVRQCAELYHQGHDIVICTSGAIAPFMPAIGIS